VQPLRARGLAVLVTGHLTVSGGSRSDSERDIHVGNLGAVDAGIFGPEFDAVALGHLHRPQSAGDGRIRYSGSPVALSFSEWQDKKQVRILTFSDGALTGSRGVEVPCARPLLRVQTTVETLEADLEAAAVPAAPLPAWFDVTVAATGETAAALAERIQTVLARRHAESVAIRRSEPSAPSPCAAPAAATIHDLTPAEVFDSVLTGAAIPEGEQPALRLVFQQLLERHREDPGGG
jgi:DNA repair protein SbcD/Mre11